MRVAASGLAALAVGLIVASATWVIASQVVRPECMPFHGKGVHTAICIVSLRGYVLVAVLLGAALAVLTFLAARHRHARRTLPVANQSPDSSA